jgi:hypothetical protein
MTDEIKVECTSPEQSEEKEKIRPISITGLTHYMIRTLRAREKSREKSPINSLKDECIFALFMCLYIQKNKKNEDFKDFLGVNVKGFAKDIVFYASPRTLRLRGTAAQALRAIVSQEYDDLENTEGYQFKVAWIIEKVFQLDVKELADQPGDPQDSNDDEEKEPIVELAPIPAPQKYLADEILSDRFGPGKKDLLEIKESDDSLEDW